MGCSARETRIDIFGIRGLSAQITGAGQGVAREMAAASRIWGWDKAMSIRETMERKLEAAFSPERLEVIDESHLHAGHSHGHQGTFDGSGGTHLRVRIVSPAFAGLSLVERHRAVNALLKDEFEGGVHALAIEAAAPGEPTRW